MAKSGKSAQEDKSSTRSSRTKMLSQRRREKDRRELRQRILKTAGQEFLEHGYESFSLRRVAERIGYTPTTIYLYFQNKDDLLLATVQEGFQEFDQLMARVASEYSDPLKRIEALGRAYIDFGVQNPALYRLMFMQRSDFYFMPRFIDEDAEVEATQELHNSDSDQQRTLARSLLVTAVEEAIKEKKIPRSEPMVTADVLWAGTHGLVSLAISPLMTPEHVSQLIDKLLTTLINGVKAK